MAKFNPETQAEGQNYLGYSRGQESNDALGVLFKGAANVVEGAATVADNHVQGNIRRDITREYDAANDSFGVDAYGVAGGSTTGPGTSSPAEIDQAKRWIGKVHNSFMAGDIKESHYAARLEQKVKDLRMRYPGYREQIDAIVSDVTGMTPANVLRQQLFNEFDAELKGQQEKRSNDEKLIDGWLAGGEMSPALGELWNSGERSPELIRAIKNDVLNRSYERAEVTSETGKLSLRKAQKEDIRDDADRSFVRAASMITNDVMKQGYDKFDFNRDRFIETLTTAGADYRIDDTERGPLLDQLNKGEAAALAALDEAIHKPWDEEGNNFANSVSDPKVIEDQRNAVLARFAHLRNMIENDKTGLLKADAAITEARQNRLMREFFERYPEMEKVATIKNALGNEIFDYVVMQKIGGTVATAAHAFVTAALMNGDIENTSVAFDEMQRTGIKEAKTYSDVLDGQIEIMTNEISDPQSKENAMRRMYSEGNVKLIDQIRSDQQIAAFEKLTNPKITESIVATGNEELKENYLRWQEDVFQRIFLQKADDINATFKAAAGEAEIVLDKDTGQLELEYTGATQPGESVRDAKARQETYALQIGTGLKDLNRFLKSFKGTTDALGRDFATEVNSVFQSLDLQVDVEEDGEDSTTELPGGSGEDELAEGIQVVGLDAIQDVDLTTADAVEEPMFSSDDVGRLVDQARNATGEVRQLQDMIGKAEGAGYNTFSGGKRLPLTRMTVAEVRDQQRNYGQVSGAISSAAGKYQIIQDTMDFLIRQGVLDPDEPFDEEAQDRAALALMERRGYSAYKSGKISREKFLDNMAKEWASIPNASGKSAYHGDGLNKATAGGKAIASLLAKGNRGKNLDEIEFEPIPGLPM